MVQRYSAHHDSRTTSHRSYNDEWADGYKARHSGDASRVSRIQEAELLPCVWNLPHC